MDSRVIRSSSRPASEQRPASVVALIGSGVVPVLAAVAVLAALTVGYVVFFDGSMSSLAQYVSVEWLVVHHAPLDVDGLDFGYLPLLPTLLYAAAIALRVRTVLAATPESPRSAGILLGALVATTLAASGIAMVLLSTSSSTFAIRERDAVEALAWSAAVVLAGGLVGVWLRHRRSLRETGTVWLVGGVHLGFAALAASCAVGAVVVAGTVLGHWGQVRSGFSTGGGAGGMFAQFLLCLGYLPNLVLQAAAVALGGETHLGEASYSVFAVAPGPLPALPIAAALPVAKPPALLAVWLVVPALVAVVLARVTAHWYARIGDAVRAALVGGAVLAVGTALLALLSGGALGAIGAVGTAWLIAGGLGFLYLGVLGALTSALTLAGLTRRRGRASARLDERRAAARDRGVRRVARPESDGPREPGPEPDEAEHEEAELDETEQIETEHDETEHDEAKHDGAEHDGAEPEKSSGHEESGHDAAEPDAAEPSVEHPDEAAEPAAETREDAPEDEH